MSDPSALEVAQRRGRRAGIAVFASLVIAFTAVCTVQIVQQVWFPEVGETPLVCREGVRRLTSAVREAREAALREVGETAALDRFRTRVGPGWHDRPALERACRGDPLALRALDELDRLRYAEEHAVRYESSDLVHRRARVEELERQLAQGAIDAPRVPVERSPPR